MRVSTAKPVIVPPAVGTARRSAPVGAPPNELRPTTETFIAGDPAITLDHSRTPHTSGTNRGVSGALAFGVAPPPCPL